MEVFLSFAYDLKRKGVLLHYSIQTRELQHFVRTGTTTFCFCRQRGTLCSHPKIACATVFSRKTGKNSGTRSKERAFLAGEDQAGVRFLLLEYLSMISEVTMVPYCISSLSKSSMSPRFLATALTIKFSFPVTA